MSDDGPRFRAAEEHVAEAPLPQPRRLAAASGGGPQAEPSPHAHKFRAVAAGLIAIAVASIVVAISLSAFGGSSAKSTGGTWSAFSPQDSGLQGAQEIADFVSPYYRATPAYQLAVVTAMNLNDPSNPLEVVVPSSSAPGGVAGAAGQEHDRLQPVRPRQPRLLDRRRHGVAATACCSCAARRSSSPSTRSSTSPGFTPSSRSSRPDTPRARAGSAPSRRPAARSRPTTPSRSTSRSRSTRRSSSRGSTGRCGRPCPSRSRRRVSADGECARGRARQRDHGARPVLGAHRAGPGRQQPARPEPAVAAVIQGGEVRRAGSHPSQRRTGSRG